MVVIAQHPPCHVWPASQAVEHSSTQSWSPLDVDQPAPGLGEGAGGGEGREGEEGTTEERGRISEKEGKGYREQRESLQLLCCRRNQISHRIGKFSLCTVHQ